MDTQNHKSFCAPSSSLLGIHWSIYTISTSTDFIAIPLGRSLISFETSTSIDVETTVSIPSTQKSKTTLGTTKCMRSEPKSSQASPKTLNKRSQANLEIPPRSLHGSSNLNSWPTAWKLFFSESSRKSCRFRNASDWNLGLCESAGIQSPPWLARLWQRVWKRRMLLSSIQFLSKSSKNKQSHRWIRVGGRKDKSLPREPVPAATRALQESAQIGQSYL